MKIIIIGNGKVGYTLARQLSGEDHELVLICLLYTSPSPRDRG